MRSISHPFFNHAAHVKARLRIADRFPRREDIHKYAASLIDLQDGRIAPTAIKLDYEERVWGRYIGRVIEDPIWPHDESSPVGIKLVPLFPLPLFHLDRTLRSACSVSRAALNLPKTVQELEAWLNEEMESVFCNTARFEKATGATIHTLARFLSAIRTTHPALFLLLLSFEIDEVRRSMRCLDEIGVQIEASAWHEVYFKKARCSILAVFEIIRILRRGTAIIKYLSAKRRFAVSEVRRVAARLRKGTSTSADRDKLEEIAISTYGLRKILLNDIDRDHALRREPGRRTFRRALPTTLRCFRWSLV